MELSANARGDDDADLGVHALAGRIVAVDASRVHLATVRGLYDFVVDRRTYISALDRMCSLGTPTSSANNGVAPVLRPGQTAFLRFGSTPVRNGMQPCTAIILQDEKPDECFFLHPSFWVDEAKTLADWWRSYAVDLEFCGYFTNIARNGGILSGPDGEDKWGYTVSRTLYGLCTAFALTGDVSFLQCARHGFEFLVHKAAFRHKGLLFFHSQMDRQGRSKSADENRVNIFTHIYALTGIVAYYDVTGSPVAHEMIKEGLRTLHRVFHDPVEAGFYDAISLPHLSPLPGETDSKSFNSIVDSLAAIYFHIQNAGFVTPGVDIGAWTRNLLLLILRHFVQRDGLYIQEVFRRDWSTGPPSWRNPYNTPQGAANVGSNLKTVWVLLRGLHSLPKKQQGGALEEAIGILEKMQHCGGWDAARLGWFDLLDKSSAQDLRARHWSHRNKVWWTQEEGILASLLMGVVTGESSYHEYARAGMQFWLTCFRDFEHGGVFDTVTDQGVPLNDFKGSWLKAGYHEIELCRFAHVYLKMLRNEPIVLHYADNSKDSHGKPLGVPAQVPGFVWHVRGQKRLCTGVIQVEFGYKRETMP